MKKEMEESVAIKQREKMYEEQKTAKHSGTQKKVSKGDTVAGVHELRDNMYELKNKLNERGEQIDEMGQKSAKMKDESASFAKNAELLNKMMSKGWF